MAFLLEPTLADVASRLNDWSATAASNNPTDNTIIGGGLADNLQEIQAVMRKDLGSRANAITAAGTTDLSTATAGPFVPVSHASGTVAITSFGTLTAGMWKVVTFSITSGTVTITHNSTQMILPGGANITVGNGDSLLMESLGSGNAKVHSYTVAAHSPGNFPSGTRMLFQQTSAPTGWTKDTSSHNDKALRVVTGSVSSGGATAFTSVFGSGKTSGSHTLTATDMPAHTHSVSITSANVSNDHTHTLSGTTSGQSVDHTHPAGDGGLFATSAVGGSLGYSGFTNNATANTGGASQDHTHTYSGSTSVASSGHTHSVSGNTGSIGSDGGHTHTLSLDLQYADVIIAAKD